MQAGKWSQWANDPKGISYPAWTADSHFIQYQNGNVPNYNRVKVGSGQIQSLFVLQNENPYATNIGAWSAATPDGSMMYTRDVSTQEIYMLDVDFP